MVQAAAMPMPTKNRRSGCKFDDNKKPAEAGANSSKTKNPPRRVFAKLEAWVGIEPAYAALQAAA
jgi:hypothetical protein